MTSRIGDVRISAQLLEELQDEQAVVRLERGDVVSVRLLFGFMAERLIAEVLFATVVFAIGLSMVRSLYWWLFEGGRMEVHVAAVVCLVPLGAMMLLRSPRRGWAIIATLKNGQVRRLALGRDRVLAARFAEEARAAGWPILEVL